MSSNIKTVASSLSKSQQVKEIVRCGKDPVYFIKNYVKIQHPIRGTIPFETYPFQDDCVQQFQQNRLNIVLKSRQLGLSTVCAAYATWMAIFQRDKNILVIATKLAVAQNFIKKVRAALDSLPSWLLLPKFEPSKQAINFNNGSVIKAVGTSEDAGRSESLSLLIIDEAAFIRNFDEIWTGMAPTFSTGGNAIILSTPNGVGGQYYTLWTEAEAGVNGFNPIKIMWYQHPEHDQAWFDKETKNLSRQKLNQEYLCSFIASGDTFLKAEDLDVIKENIKPPFEKHGIKRDIWVWFHPRKDGKYLMSADVARGDAHDYSAFHIIDVIEREIVVEYMGKLPPEQFADLMMEWGKKYNDALLIPENNSFGYSVATKIRDAGYRRLYYENYKGDPFGYVPIFHDELPGFGTNGKTRVQILTKLEELLRTGVLKTYSQRLYDQLLTFIWNNNRPEASSGAYDDLVMCLAIGGWLLETAPGGPNDQRVNMAYAMLAATCVTRREVQALNFGTNKYAGSVNIQSRQFMPGMRPGQFGHTNFNWLL